MFDDHDNLSQQPAAAAAAPAQEVEPTQAEKQIETAPPAESVSPPAVEEATQAATEAPPAGPEVAGDAASPEYLVTTSPQSRTLPW